MKKRLQITLSEETMKKMDLSKNFYGGYSGLIEKAVEEFLSLPVEPYTDDIEDADAARKSKVWIEIEELKRKILEK